MIEAWKHFFEGFGACKVIFWYVGSYEQPVSGLDYGFLRNIPKQHVGFMPEPNSNSTRKNAKLHTIMISYCSNGILPIISSPLKCQTPFPNRSPDCHKTSSHR